MGKMILRMDYSAAKSLSKKCENIYELIDRWEKKLEMVSDSLRRIEEPSAKRAAEKAIEIQWELKCEENTLRFMSENLKISAEKIRDAQERVLRDLHNSGEGQ